MIARLTAIVLALALRHGHHDVDRLRGVAEDVWHAAEIAPAYCGSAAVEATALSLVAIAEHESGWSPRVQDCTHDVRAPSLTLYQLQGRVSLAGHTRARVCSDNALAAQLAAAVLARYQRAASVDVTARGYASGDPRVVSRAAREIAAIATTLHWRERITVSYRDGCLTADYLETK